MSSARLAARPVAPALFALAMACTEPPPWEGNFDTPEAVTVLQDGVGGPFIDPIAYAASTDGGQISLIDLRKGIYLADEPEASFVRASPLPTGRDRVIAGLAAWAPDPETIDVWVADRAFRKLLRVPHVTGLDDGGAPMRFPPTHTDPVFVDVDGSDDKVAVDQIALRLGYTSTEDWVFEYDGVQWSARGSRSGRQEKDVLPYVHWSADRRALGLTIHGTPTAGDRIEMSTDSGIEEIDVGGVPMAVAMSPDQRWLAVSVTDPEAELSYLRIVDPATGSLVADAALAADAVPGRLAWTPDGATLYATDFRREAVWGVAFDVAGPGLVTEYALPFTAFDVTSLRQADGSDLLYVAPTSGHEVWLYDTGAHALVDFNPMATGVDGLRFDIPVRGLDAIPLAYEWPRENDDGIRPWGRSVAVSLFDGQVVFMGEGNGCLVPDLFGPRTDIVQQQTSAIDYNRIGFDDDGTAGLEPNATNDRSVIVNRCGGVARREVWVLTYRRDLQAWEVEGSRSGPQERLAYEDVRYLSDEGAVSFTIRGGVLPSEDGWQINFSVLPGVVTAQADTDGDGDRDIEFDMPGDPAFFHHDTVEQREDGWVEVRESPFVLVPATSADLIGRIDPRDGAIQVIWW